MGPWILLAIACFLAISPPASGGTDAASTGSASGDWIPWEQRERVSISRQEILAALLRESPDLEVERTGPEIASAVQRIVRGEFDPHLEARWTVSHLERQINQYDAESRRLIQTRESFEAAAREGGATDPEALLADVTRAEDGTQVIPLPDGTGIAFSNADDLNRLTEAFRAEAFEIREFEEDLETGVFALSQLLPTGTVLEARLTQQGLENSLTRELSPSGVPLSPFFPDQTEVLARLQATQPLLRGAGFGANLVQVRIARANFRRAEADLRAAVHRRVGEALTAYYELAYGLEQVEVERQSVHAARVLVEDKRKRLAEGVVDVSEVGRAETSLAEREDRLLAAQRRAFEAQTRLLRLTRRDPTRYDAQVLLVPAEGLPVEPPPTRRAPEVLATARLKRPELEGARAVIEAARHRLRFHRNQLLPELNLVAAYGYRGLGGSAGEAWDQARQGEYHEWAAGLELRFPIGNHLARGERDRSSVLLTRAEREMARMEADVVEQAVVALDALHIHYRRVERAAAGRRAGEETYRAEKRRFEEGKSTTWLVLDASQNARIARLIELSARLEYRRAAIQLELAEGTVLERNGLVWNGTTIGETRR